MGRLFLILFTGCFISSSFSIEKKGSLTIEIYGFEDNQGVAYVGLYREADDFPKMNAQFKGKTIGISNKSVKLKFTDLPDEKFAVAVFHDRNKNGKLDRNLLGIPTESYGFSNNAREMFSSPSFSSASFNVKSETIIKIQIR
ncbi:MAG: DUF2141 domain-containing protein [Crocinitomicaceae bacterium]|jgi:uncharacterized protein (DUF2141 family)|nr:DUF2141 domain-containing protein [Crocinitomicaceae bacterium]